MSTWVQKVLIFLCVWIANWSTAARSQLTYAMSALNQRVFDMLLDFCTASMIAMKMHVAILS